MLASGGLGFLVALILTSSLGTAPAASPSPTASVRASETSPPGTPASPELMVGAGDIAGCDTLADSQTAELIAGTPGVVFTLGDNAPIGRRHDYEVCYGETWGAELDRTRPVIGDEDYVTNHGQAYFEYFDDRAGANGYYSFEVGDWHVIVLNSECDEVGGCGPDSVQGRWLAADLASHPAECTMALWHRPLISSAGSPDAAWVRPFWQALYAAGAELVLNGHFHAYQRFEPLNPNLEPDDEHGIREIIAGTGGNQPMQLTGEAAHLEVQDRAFGVLLLRLYPRSYEWEFVPVRGEEFRDGGRGSCHGPKSG